MRSEEREQLLYDLSSVGARGRAEQEQDIDVARSFLPVQEHLRALDSDVVLIVGARGAGKSQLFRVLTEPGPKLLNALLPFSRVNQSSRPHGRTTWVPAFPWGRDGFDESKIRRTEMQRYRSAWFAYLLRRLEHHLDQASKASLTPLFTPPSADFAGVCEAMDTVGDQAILALDRLDERLEKSDEFLFVAYDELDLLGGGDWKTLMPAVQGLVAFWAAHHRRWRRIRAKIFMRSDVFERQTLTAGADLAKIAASKVELSWTDRNLLAMLLKRLTNRSEHLARYIKGSSSKIKWHTDDILGQMPVLTRAEDARPVIERMVGTYMGAGKKKGIAWRWILAHSKDGNGRGLPRPFVRLFEEAAALERESLRASGTQLLHPTTLRNALNRVSHEHFDYVKDEWPWLNELKSLFAPGVGTLRREVPWEKNDVKAIATRLWDSLQRLPEPVELTQTPYEMVDHFVRLGIFRARPDGRIDVPDLFLDGLGLVRKGGVKLR